jgi:hypothetical protein
MIKQLLLFTAVLLTVSVTGMAQEAGDKTQTDKGVVIEKIIIAHIIKELNITPDEAQQFCPVFNNYWAEHKTAAQTHKNDIIKREGAILAVRKKYKPEFQRILSSEKRANGVYTSLEHAINIMKEHQQRKQQHPGHTGIPDGRRGNKN